MCEIIKRHVKDLLIITEKANKHLDGTGNADDKKCFVHLNKRHSIFASDIYGFYKALKTIEEDFNGLKA